MSQTAALELLVKTQQEQLLRQQEINASQAESIRELTNKVNELLSQLAWFNRQFFGRKSEKLAHLDPNQRSLFEEYLSAAPPAEEVEEARQVAVAQITEPVVNRKEERRQRKLLEDLPVVEVVIEPEGVDLEKYKRIGEERTRTLEFEPGRLYVREIVRPKYGLRDNTALPQEGKSSVLIATLPLLPIHKGLPGASMLTEILLQKYEYHVPFYRQVQAFHHLGLRIPEQTLSGWFKPACELLSPLYEVLKTEVLASDYVQVDETTIPVVDHDAHKAKKEYLWVVRSVMDRQLFFHYDDGSRSGRTVEKLLQSFTGYLQSDGYDGYNVFEKKTGVCLVACMSHIRRAYEKSLDEHRSLAEYALKEIQHLYRIERMADEKEMTPEERRALRLKLAAPVMDAFEKWMEETHPTVLPKSNIGKAIEYSYTRWGRMRNYLKDGRLMIDNNPVENAVRPIAIGRKNFLFCGNHQAAAHTAIICSLLASCKGIGVNPREWLNDVIAKMPYYCQPGKTKSLKELLPIYWNRDKLS